MSENALPTGCHWANTKRPIVIRTDPEMIDRAFWAIGQTVRISATNPEAKRLRTKLRLMLDLRKTPALADVETLEYLIP